MTKRVNNGKDNNLKIINQINYINNNIPFYNRIAATNIGEIPIITKTEIREDYEQFISKEYKNDVLELLKNLYGNSKRVGNSYNEFSVYKDYIFEETSGTSGIPFRVVKTRGERINIGYTLWKMRQFVDQTVSPQKFLGLNHIKIDGYDWKPYEYDKKHLFSLYEYISTQKFRWIHISPTPLLKHIEILGNDINNFDLSQLRYIECAGNFISNEQKEIIENYFKVQIVNQYGSIETWPIAQSTKYIELLKPIEDNVYIEIVDDDCNVITEPEVIGNVVVTTLNLKVMPLIRYKTGDLAKYVEIDSIKYLKLQEGREINLIGGLEKRVWGNIFFHKIVQDALRLSNMPDEMKYIQIQQHSKNHFVIEINKFPDAIVIVDNIKKICNQERMNDWEFEYRFLDESELRERECEKKYLFIRKYDGD